MLLELAFVEIFLLFAYFFSYSLQAAELGKTDVCDVLCSRGANVNLANSFGNTPMHAVSIPLF